MADCEGYKILITIKAEFIGPSRTIRRSKNFMEHICNPTLISHEILSINIRIQPITIGKLALSLPQLLLSYFSKQIFIYINKSEN